MSRRVSRSKKLRRKSRRARLGTVIYRLLCIALVVGAGAVALTVFFKVENVTVTGVTRYSVEQIRQTLGVEHGDNLFFWGKTAGLQRLKREYPYIESVRVRRRLPDTLEVEITECAAFAALDNGMGGFYLLSGGGKLLEATEAGVQSELPRITGVSAAGRKVGETLGGAEEEAENALISILTAMTANGQIKNVNFINIEDPYDIHIGYLDRFDVRIGSVNELDRKLQFLIKLINEKLSPSDIGTIELSNVAKIYFWPDTLENVQAASGIPPAVAPDETNTQSGQAPAQDEDGGAADDEAAPAA